MTIQRVTNRLGDTSTYTEAGKVVGGFILADTVGPAITDRIAQATGMDIFAADELDGIIVAAAFYGYGNSVPGLSQSDANKVGLGGVVAVLDALAERFNVRQQITSAMPGGGS